MLSFIFFFLNVLKYIIFLNFICFVNIYIDRQPGLYLPRMGIHLVKL